MLKAAKREMVVVPIIKAMAVQGAFVGVMNNPEIETIAAPPATVVALASPNAVADRSERKDNTPALAAGMVRPFPNPTKAQGRKKAVTWWTPR